MKIRFTSTEEELQQLKEHERLLKEADEKFKSIEGEESNRTFLRSRLFYANCEEASELGRFWKIFKDEFRNRNK